MVRTTVAGFSFPPGTAAPPSRADIDVTLLVPPAWEPSFQSLGIPSLAAFLRHHGFPVRAVDLNIAFFHRLGGGQVDIKAARAAYSRVVGNPSFLARYQPRRNDERIRIELPFGFAQVVCCNYSRLPALLCDLDCNPLIRFYSDSGILDDICSRPAATPLLVGLTVEGENQIVGVLTFARLLKERRPDALVVLGGSWITSMKASLAEEQTLLADIDFLVPGKGEAPLLSLCRAVAAAGRRPLEPVEGVMSKADDGTFDDPPPLSWQPRFADAPRPDLADIRLYGRPNVLPYERERGCYWGQCHFCHHIQHYEHRRAIRSAGKLVEDIRAYQERMPVEVIAFADAAVSPHSMREIAEAFIAAQLDVRWACFARIERKFTSDLFALARRSGLDVVSFGIETASARLSRFIGKPIDSGVAREVVAACAKAGIFTTAGIINGLPSETDDELAELWEFLDTIKTDCYLHPHLFSFERGTPFFDEAGAFGLVAIPNHPEERLSVYHDYVDLSGSTTRKSIRDGRLNKAWWEANMGRTLDWKSHGRGFCKAVQSIVGT